MHDRGLFAPFRIVEKKTYVGGCLWRFRPVLKMRLSSQTQNLSVSVQLALKRRSDSVELKGT